MITEYPLFLPNRTELFNERVAKLFISFLANKKAGLVILEPHPSKNGA